jgi:hypothetical protein
VITGNWGNDMSLLVKAAKDAGLNTRFITYYAGGLGTPQAMGASGEGKVLQLTEWHMNVPTKNTEKFALDFNKKYPGVWFYYLRDKHHGGDGGQGDERGQVAPTRRRLRWRWKTCASRPRMAKSGCARATTRLMQPLFISVFSQGRRQGRETRLGRHRLRLEDAGDDLPARFAIADCLHHGTSLNRASELARQGPLRPAPSRPPPRGGGD